MRQRQHVNPLGLSFEELRDDPPALAPGRPVEVEVGCAEAQFLFERAAAEPRATYVGIEIRDWLVDQVNARAAEIGAPVVAVFCSANHHLDRVIPRGRARRVFLNFPDPWFKRRHKKRRMIDAPLIASIHRILEPGGEVLVQSDVWDVALDAMDLFERRDDLFANRAGPWSFWKRGNPYGARSWREQHCEAEGLPIWRILYDRRKLARISHHPDGC